MQAQLHDGRILEFPDGTDPAVVQATVRKVLGVNDAPIDPAMGEGNVAPQLERTALESVVDKILPAYTKGQEGYDKAADVLPGVPNTQQMTDLATGASGLMRGGANLISEGAGDKIWPKEGSTGGGYETLGKFLDPVAWTIGGGVTKALPYAPMLGHGTKQGLLSLGKNLTSGALTGGSIGGLSEDMTAGEGAAFGAGLNVLLPPMLTMGAKGIGSLKNMVNPDPANIAARAAGDKVDDVVNALMTNKSTVPGMQLNAGQASTPSGSAEFAALQKLVDKVDPTPNYAFKTAQETTRQKAVQKISRTKEIMDRAIKSRTATASRSYKLAEQTAIKADEELLQLSKNPYFKDAWKDAEKIAKASGVSPKENLTGYLHIVKENLDEALRKAGDTALKSNEKRIVGDVKQSLLKWLDKKNPAYAAAREKFIQQSKPINQMKVGQDLEQALVSPTGVERASSFGSAVRKAENTISKSTGKPRIEDITPQQKKVIDAIQENLQQNEQFNKLAAAGGDSMKERIGIPKIPPTGFFKPIVSAARSWINNLTGGFTDEGVRALSPLMRDPEKLAQMMKNLSPKERVAFEIMLQKTAQSPIGGFVSAQGGQ